MAIQHELAPGLAVHTTYVRRWFGNQTVTDNLGVEPADFDPYCIDVPADPRLPGGRGYQQCGYYDVKPAKFGQVQNFITYASNFGSQKEVYSGVDVTVSARLPNGAQITGGTNTARLANNRCFVVDSPEELLFCDVKPPFLTMVKLMGAYPLPWGTRLSGAFQSLPGPEISTATIVVRSAQIAPTLGRNLSAGANATVTLPLLQPGTLYGKRYNRVDVRFSKTFDVAQYRLVGSLDVFNLLNGAGIIAVNTRYRPVFRNPISALGARLFRVSAQIDF